MRCKCCKKPYVLEDGMPAWAPLIASCECSTCFQCERVFREDDPDGPGVAPTDEAAAEWGDDPRCNSCWAEILGDSQ